MRRPEIDRMLPAMRETFPNVSDLSVTANGEFCKIFRAVLKEAGKG